MRVCLICTERLPVPPLRGGAIQTYIEGVLPWLVREHDVTVVCRTDPDLPDREEVGGVRFVRVPSGDLATYFGNVAAYLRAEAPFGLVEVFNRPAQVLPLAEAAGGARLVLSMHNDMFQPERIAPEEARAVLSAVSHVVTISDYVGETIDGLHPGFAGKLRTVRSGVDLDRFVPAWRAGALRRRVRRELGLEGRPVVLYVSRLSRNKGNHLVVEAMAQVRGTHPQAALLMVGSSRYGTQELDAYGRAVCDLARSALGDAVRFVGFVPPTEVHRFFPAGDLFVCASQWPEPLARVHYEAMAAGLPIITTDRGGNAEVMEEEGNGLFFRPHDDPSALAAQIGRLLDDAAWRERMGRRGRALAEERYTWERVGRDLLTVFAEVPGR